MVVESRGVARGYLNVSRPRWAPLRRGRTTATPCRMYRTGDLAKYNADGSLEFIGCRNNQVKINGQRVELLEVEKVLSAYTIVRRVVTSVQRTDNVQIDLVAVLCLEEPELPTRTPLKNISGEFASKVEEQIENIRLFLASRLPTYMVPTTWRVVEELPRTASMKIDRSSIKKWLLQWEPANTKTLSLRILTSPASEIERIIRATWSNALSVPLEDIGRESSIIILRGDSIAATNVATKYRKRGVKVSVATLLRSESLANVAAASEVLPGHTISSEGAKYNR
ncbi:hypothetical protein F5B20DRAFT_526713 [Whalleya microplaca]|nr:hypothetical protein F5B20DRAFT_526713 [Whalleya microplaca]